MASLYLEMSLFLAVYLFYGNTSLVHSISLFGGTFVTFWHSLSCFRHWPSLFLVLSFFLRYRLPPHLCLYPSLSVSAFLSLSLSPSISISLSPRIYISVSWHCLSIYGVFSLLWHSFSLLWTWSAMSLPLCTFSLFMTLSFVHCLCFLGHVPPFSLSLSLSLSL